jgi:hypothetical protein
VRGPISRKAVSDAKRKQSPKKAARIGSPEASQPMPIPTAPPPGARLAKPAAAKAERAPRNRPATDAAQAAAAPVAVPKSGPVNDVLPFLSFVEHHPVGTSVVAVVDHYSSHGAYVRIGDVVGYVPLRLMADPAPRSAREVMAIGENVTLVVDSFVAARRSIDLAVPIMAPVAVTPAKAAKAPRKKAAAKQAPTVSDAAETTPAPAKRSRKQAAAPAHVEPAPPVEPAAAKAPRKKAAAKAAAEVAPADVAPAKAPRKKAAAKAAPTPAAAPAPKATRKKAAPAAAAPDPEPAPKRTRKKAAG